MPNARLERTRASLPEGYQFGDAHVSHPAYDGLGRDRALVLVRSLRTHSTAPEHVDDEEHDW